ncbi:lecithin retinol acyltransferase family protein [Photobacterium sp. SDRW27]|uniref:lecithin retinol acyltransferase family protein n=1 Tax=Photobacterium obscurum TaxID=2829490 RepID=UPI002243D527|nr:lecithin retinol acyltransferase family protein [Photobacterium obscurum]MCW8327954.1 lecithin retinol acyltransferase family protein [Photobacterium obscurum]
MLAFDHSPGTVLKIRCSTYWHYGISDGEGGVVHNSKKRRRVQLDTLDEFAEGREIVVSSITSDKPERAYHYACQQIGRPYNLFSQNCEQFVREAHGLPVECTQFQQCLVAFAGSYIVLKADAPVLKFAGMGLLLGAMLSPSEHRPYSRAVNSARLVVGSTMWLSHILKRIALL